jgi:hypothetical protein
VRPEGLGERGGHPPRALNAAGGRRVGPDIDDLAVHEPLVAAEHRRQEA